MDLFKLVAKIGLDTTEYERGIASFRDTMEKAAKGYDKFVADVTDGAKEAAKGYDKFVADVTDGAEEIAEATEEVAEATEEVAEETEKATTKAKRHWWQLGETVNDTGQQVKASTIMLGHWMYDLTKKAAGIGASLVKIGLSYNSQMEDYTTNFRVMLGSMAAAEAKVEELKSMAAKTPFAMEDLADATQTLLAFGVQSDKTTSVMTRLGDISLGNAQRLSSLSNAYGKAAAQGKLTGEVVQMMVDAGFNPLLQISKETGESMTELQKRMSAGAVSIDELDLALKRATSDGGQFYRGMEEASKTLSGQLSTLEDNWNAMLGQAMAPVNEQLSSKILPKAIESLDKLSDALFGVGEDAESAKKKLFLNTEGEEIDPSANLLTWINNLMATWTDGLTEDQPTIDSFVTQFNDNTNSIKTALLARINNLSEPVSLEEQQAIELKIGQIDSMQARVEELLTKRAGGYITPDEEAELLSIIETLKAMQTELEAAASFDSNIVTPWERLVSAAGTMTTDGIDKLADFFEWCAEDGENANAVLDGAAIALGAIAGLKYGGLLGALAGGAVMTIVRNLDKIANAAKRAYNWLSKVTGVEVSYSKAEAYENGLGETWDVDENTGKIYAINEDGSTSNNPENLENYEKKWWADPFGIGKLSNAIHGDEAEPEHATGLDYVPYNNYRARLHEGEAVLTKMEATQWRSGGMAQPEKIDYNRLAETIVSAFAASGIGFSIGGRELATLTAGDNTRAINARQNDINIGRLRF